MVAKDCPRGLKQIFSADRPHRRGGSALIQAWMRAIGMLLIVYSIAPCCAGSAALIHAAFPHLTVSQRPCAAATGILAAPTDIPAPLSADDRPLDLPLHQDLAGASHASHALLIVSGLSIPADLALIEHVGGLIALEPVSAIAAVAVPPPR